MEQWKLMLEAHNCGLLRSSVLWKHGRVNVGDPDEALCGQGNSREEGSRKNVVTLFNVLKQRVQQVAHAAHTQISPARRKPTKVAVPQRFAPPPQQVGVSSPDYGWMLRIQLQQRAEI